MVEFCEDDVWSGMGWSWEDLIDYWPEVLEKSVIYPVQPRLWSLVLYVILHAVNQSKLYENSSNS